MGFVSRFVPVTLALLPIANAFLAGSGNYLASARLSNRISPAVCSLRGSAQDGPVSRRDLLGSAFTFASVLTLQTLPAFAEDDYKMSGDYKVGEYFLVGSCFSLGTDSICRRGKAAREDESCYRLFVLEICALTFLTFVVLGRVEKRRCWHESDG